MSASQRHILRVNHVPEQNEAEKPRCNRRVVNHYPGKMEYNNGGIITHEIV